MTNGLALLHASLNGEPLSEEELEAMNQWVCASPENAALAAKLTHLDQSIASHVRARAAKPLVGMDDSDLIGETLSRDEFAAEIMQELIDQAEIGAIHEREQSKLAEQPTEDKQHHIHADDLWWAAGKLAQRAVFSKPGMLAALAAVVLLAVWLAVPSNDKPQSDDDLAISGAEQASIATLTLTRDASWAGQVPRLGEPLGPGTMLALTAGQAEITTSRGAVAVLQAPCTIELTDQSNALTLHSGKLVGLCHTTASKGFTVHTRHATIVDLGTEFGVHVLPNAVTTTVFTGEVSVDTPDTEPQTLTTHQTARVSVSGDNRKLVVQDKLARGFDKLIRPAIVTDARINLDGFEVRVVPRGVREDALLFTDRVHEINGLDNNGIPRVLRGGDLVMMPGDARPDITPGTKGLELELELAQPADIYILMPDTAKPQAWLKRDYEQTPLRVGHDRGEGTANEAPAVGSGNSIDNDFIVWKRSVDQPGTVTAGYGINFTMYAIIVVPKEQGGPTQP